MLAMTCTLLNYMTKSWIAIYDKKREKKPQGIIHVELCRAAIRRTVIAFKDSEYWV